MSKNLGRIAYIIALAALKKKGGSSGGETPGNPGDTVYEYAVKHNVTNLPEIEFNKAWKDSLNPKPFQQQLLEYLQSIGYNQNDLTQANKYILQLVNGEIKPSDDFYTTAFKEWGIKDKKEIDTIMISLFNHTLVPEELYNKLTSLGYKEDFSTFESTLYELFTEEFTNTTPYDYFKEINPDNSLSKDEFDKVYTDMATGNYIYTLAQKYLPKIENGQVDKILYDLFSGAFYNTNKTIYDHFMEEYDYKGTEDNLKKWLIALVNGELQSPWMLAQELGNKYNLQPPQTQEEFNELYFTYLCRNVVDGGSGDSFGGDYDNYLPEPDKNMTLYEMYKAYVGYEGTESELYNQLWALANYYMNGIANGSNADNSQAGDDVFSGNFVTKPDIPSINQKTLYQLYADIADKDNQLTEQEFTDKFNNYMNSLLPEIADGGNSVNNTNPNGVFSGDFLIKDTICNNKNLYQLFIDCGMSSNDITQEEFDKKMSDLAGKSDIPYSVNSDGEDIYSGNYKEKEFNFNQKSLYELYCDIVTENRMNENEFNDRIEALTQEIVHINADGDVSYSGSFNNSSSIEINQKNLYQLYKDISLNDITEEEFNTKLLDYIERSNLPYIADGGNGQDNNLIGSDSFEGEFEINSVNHDCYIEAISGGAASGNGWGNDAFYGQYLSNKEDTDNLYNDLVQHGYKYSKDDLLNQMIEIFGVNKDYVSVDGGSSDSVLGLQEYEGDIAKIHDILIDYLIKHGFNPTPENIGQFEDRFMAFSNGILLGNVNDDSGTN